MTYQNIKKNINKNNSAWGVLKPNKKTRDVMKCRLCRATEAEKIEHAKTS